MVAAAAACTTSSAPPEPWLYDAPLALGPRPPSIGGFGRGVRPVSLWPAGIVAPALGPSAPPISLEDLLGAEDGAAEAVGFGMAGDELVLELIDVDAGVVRWRNGTTALSPRSFAGDVIVVGDDARTAGLERASGVERWRHDGAFRARDGELLAMAASDGVVLVDVRDGRAEMARITPGAVPPTSVMSICAGGVAGAPYLFAYRDGKLMRWDVAGDELREVWAVASVAPARVDGCGDTVVVLGGDPRVAVAHDAATGAIVGGPVAAREMWPARGDAAFVELATPEGIERRDRRLGGARRLEAARVGRLVARRGNRRLAARGDGGLVLLDEHGARAIAEPYGVSRAALGDRYLVGGGWALPARSMAVRPARYLLPPAGAIATPQAPLGKVAIGDPPRIDLPPAEPLPAAVALDGAGAWSVNGALVDAADPARVYVLVLEAVPSATRGAGIAAFDLRANRWLWHAPEACPPGVAVALAATSRVVVCGARQNSPGTGAVRAIDRRDGATVWEWRGITVDAVLAAGRGAAPGAEPPKPAATAAAPPIAPPLADAADVILVTEGARVLALDPATGAVRATWRASDGWLPRVALVRRTHDVVVASLEHGHVVLRSGAYGLRPFAAVEVRGVVSAMFAVGERLAVTLTDGTLYLVDTDGAAAAAGGLAPGWDVAGDLAAVTTTDGTGADGVVVAYGIDGVPRIEVTLPGSGPVGIAPRAARPAAPVALVGSGGVPRITVLTAAGRAVRVVDLPVDAPRTPVVATEVDGTGVVAAFLARPLRLVRIDVPPSGDRE